MAIKKRDVSGGAGVPVTPLVVECMLLKKYMAVAEFLALTSYDDGSERVPGYAWLSNRGHAYELTLFDPDGCAKLPCLGRTWDECFALAEAHIKGDNAPWQRDKFLEERKVGKKKK